jgi:hypothetical protein
VPEEVPSSVCKQLAQLDLSVSGTPHRATLQAGRGGAAAAGGGGRSEEEWGVECVGGFDMALQTSFDLAEVQEWAVSLPRIDVCMQV